ncbi:hypothetical protein [Lactiplantibacillus herbarum]|uniref:hypothetical protein n=1 Tax=Lactiplantibacillus herbarum TaxID=1670446 RepID=UPI00064E4C97|nr:hypothetical protein [Lactiplantibacillus herbarum]
MKNVGIISWLCSGDEVLRYLTEKYLLGQKVKQRNKGYIQCYFDLFDENTSEWGGGIYSPLWTSSHYTLLELKYMEADYTHCYYQLGAQKVLDGLWFNKGKVSTSRYQDTCVSAMLVSILVYGRFDDTRINEIVDYLLAHQMTDGGWNCAWDSTTRKSKRSSFNTTICVLECFADYQKYGYDYRLKEIKNVIQRGQAYLLSRHLMYSLNTHKLAHPEFDQFFYPPRYKYDSFRALEYFVDSAISYDNRMYEALALITDQLDDGRIRTGKKHGGKTHFRLEKTKFGRFNTYRALKILKAYDYERFKRIVH